jgi:2'-5' RNA ligase
MEKEKFKYPNVSVWLVPKEEQEEELRDVINELAERYESNGFIPHITVYFPGNSIDPKEVIRVVKDEIKGVKPIKVKGKSVGFSDEFTQTMYVAYKESDNLVVLYKRLKEHWDNTCVYKLNPHLSLAYSHKMSEEDKKREAERINYPQELVLNRIMVVVKDGGIIAEEKDILDWRVEFEAELHN